LDVDEIVIRKLASADLAGMSTFDSQFNRTHRDDLDDQAIGLISFWTAWLGKDPVGHGLINWSGARELQISSAYPGCPEIYRMSVLQDYQSTSLSK
jgi:hypothetical protein